MGFTLGWMKQTSAQAVSCYGETCNDQNPVVYQCDQDAVVIEETSKVVFRWQDEWQPRQIVVQKLYSKSCHANWTNAYIPEGAFLFVREQEITNGTQSVRGMLQANGTEYFWAQSGMSDGNVANQACVSLPLLSITIGHDLYDHHCTDFS